jgi:23S rRNA (uracil1939-C5)-methyltransferase
MRSFERAGRCNPARQVRGSYSAVTGLGAAERSSRLLYVNPPRTGLESEVLGWAVNEFRPERLAYLSCSAGTLSRDLSGLAGAGYAVEALHPYDFFPQTHHVETLALLRRIA